MFIAFFIFDTHTGLSHKGLYVHSSFSSLVNPCNIYIEPFVLYSMVFSGKPSCMLTVFVLLLRVCMRVQVSGLVMSACSFFEQTSSPAN